MATVTYIPEHTQSQTAMRRVMDYVAQDKKTLYKQDDRQYKLISGKDCYPEIAFHEFMATKRQYGKAVGMFFYQYVQSFPPKENITPEKAHAVGIELAEYFKGHEVLIATHLDAGQIHTHFVINSVSFETGLKLQEGPDSLLKLRKLSDEICLTHSLSVLPAYSPSHSGTKGLNAREYRAAEKGDSWKFRLMGAIDQSLSASRTKAEFVDNMAVLGYRTDWTPNRKHITYTTPDGRKCRDNKLHEGKYLKPEMEGHFLELSRIKKQEQAGSNAGSFRNGESVAEALYSDSIRDTARAVGSHDNDAVRSGSGYFRNAGIYDLPADEGLSERKFRPRALENGSGPLRGNNAMPGNSEKLDRMDKIGNGRTNGGHGKGYSGEYGGNKQEPKRKPQSAGLVADQPADEMDRRRRGYYDAMLGGAESPETDLNPKIQKEKQQVQNLHEQPKQWVRRKVRNQNREDGWSMEM